MQFPLPAFSTGVVFSALIATQLLTGAAAAPMPAAPAVAHSPAGVAETVAQSAAPDRVTALRTELAELAAEATKSLETPARAITDPATPASPAAAELEWARAALSTSVLAAQRLTPSAWITTQEPGAHLIGGEQQVIAELERDLATLADDLALWESLLQQSAAAEAAREAEAAAERAELAAAATAASAVTTPRADPPGAAPSGGGFTLSPAGTGGQSLIDACIGPVWWTPSWFPYLAEHWHCGGSAFPKQAGAVITIAGSGVYQSAGIVKQVNAYVEDMNAVPGGYDVYYQTCLNNDPATSVIIGLVRIG